MRRLIRLFFYLVILAVVLVVAGILLLDTIVREVAESQIRAATGMDAKIGKFSVGLATPTIRIQDFKLYNNAEFGGSPFIEMPELFIEYDPASISARKLHLKLVRINLSEMSIIKDKKGRKNTDGLEAKQKQNNDLVKIKTKGFEFTGIDTLNLSLGKLHITDPDVSASEKTVDFGISNQVFRNVKSENDLAGVAFMLAAKSGCWSLFQPTPQKH